ncbi:MAG: hypothetical protein R3290_03760 [Acidimicrobiia bacterium]|nr:hypothetical protein [Acidimicrobiia bacterium]
MAVAGVAEAEVDESGTNPSGVRVRLAPDADAQSVGIEVQRILASHGMRSRVNGGNSESSGNGAPVVPLPTEGSGGDSAPANPPPAAPPMPAAVPPSGENGQEMSFSQPDRDAPPAYEPPSAAGRDATFATLRVDESPEGLVITATASDGRSLTQRSGPSEDGLYESVVSAVGALADGRPPTLVDVERKAVDGTEIVTVVVERADGTRFAGSAVVRAGKAFAVARATWSALRAG